jgi:hypothetical protein
VSLGTLLVTGCGGSGSEGGQDEVAELGSSGAAGSEQAEAEGSGTQSTGDAPTSTDNPDAGDEPSTGSDEPSTGSDEPSSTGSEGEVKFDVGGMPDLDQDCQCGSTLGFSYIWISNSTQGTVTKLNTETMIEEGRYLTRQDQNGSPSRTSVALSGRAVAVANRNGGLVKVFARPEDCDPNKNGMPGLQTSMNANFLPWGQDDCIDWLVPFAYTTQRPVAWAPGILNQSSCEYEQEKVWTAGCAEGQHTWAQVSFIDGDSGTIEFTVDMQGFECSSLSPYGGAVDAEGNFWFTNLVPGQDRLGFVDRNTQDFQVWNMPITPYGMTVDHDGNPWIAAWAGSQNASAARFDVLTETWSYANNHIAYSLSGIQEDASGRMWMNYWTYDGQNNGDGLVYIDMDTMQVSEPFPLGCPSSSCRGMSVDLNGMVWSTSMSANTAYRFNPDTQQIDTYNQLVGPYTYSDMTGWGIQSTACGPQG